VSIDVTDQVHPEVAAMAVLAARVVGLDIAGIDLVATDIGQPLEGQGGAIVEVNAGPGLLMHIKPSSGQAQPVGEAIVEHLFPGDTSPRIPLVGVTGSYGKSTVARLVAYMLRMAGRHTGLASSQGLFFGARQVSSTDAAVWSEAQRVLLNRAVDAAVIENGARAILTEGLAYDRCQVGVVTCIDPDVRFPDLFIEEPEQLFTVYRTQVDVVLPNGVAVLNADDDRVCDMASLCDGEVVYFGSDASRPALAQHLETGGRAVVASDGWLLLAHGRDRTVLTELAQVPLLQVPASQAHRLRNVLAAVAAGWALGLDADVLRTSVHTYSPEAPAMPVETAVGQPPVSN
jgi:cyanophycin synthetase